MATEELSGQVWRFEFPESVEMISTVLGVEQLKEEVEKDPRNAARLAKMKEAHALPNTFTLNTTKDGNGNPVLRLQASEGQQVRPIYDRISELLAEVGA